MTVPLILAIDTSCDDTSVSVTRGTTVLSNVISSQTQLHKPYGGVFPTVAKQAHKENIESAVRVALRRAHISPQQLTAVAVTQGPGLAPALEVGITHAKRLAIEWQKPLIACNHIEGHVLSVLAQQRSRAKISTSQQLSSLFPALSIIVSGGHTQLVLVRAVGDYTIVGKKIDDAAGECLDKVGRLLGLGYPAGALIEEFAKLGNSQRFVFPLPMTESRDFNFSFSGLKTFSRNLISELESQKALDKQTLYDFCASLQYAVFRHITHKLNKLLSLSQTQHDDQTIPKLQSVWLGGGVAANMTLRSTLRSQLRPFGLKLLAPYSRRVCADNAAMIGIAASFRLHTQISPETLIKYREENISAVDRKPRWSLEEIDVLQ